MSDDLHCGTCKHWRKRPPDPANLGAPRLGECLESPPIFLPVARGFWAGYPILPEGFTACSRHELAVLDAGDLSIVNRAEVEDH